MSSEPERDPRVPAQAVWDPERKEFCVCPMADGERHGDSVWYRPDGSLACECPFERGKSHGPYKRFHQNGEVSQYGEMRRGKCHGVIHWIRSTAQSTEVTIPPGVPDSVWSMTADFVDGVPYPVRFFDRAGSEVLPNGEPLPPRPEGVDERATFDPQDRRWYYGLGSQGHEQRDGLWQWWDEEGKLVLEADHTKGTRTEERGYDPPGTLSRTAIYDSGGKVAFTHWHTISVPERPEGVDPDALFDGHAGAWILAPGLAPGKARNGVWKVWNEQGRLDSEEQFVDGRRRSQRKYHDNGKLFVERVHDAEGRETRVAYFYKVGDLNHSIDREFEDGKLESVEIHKYPHGLKAKGKRDEQGIAYEFFGAEGKPEGSGHVDDDDNAVGTWTFHDGDQTYELDMAEYELSAKVDEDFGPSILLGRALLSREGDKTPRAEQLAGIDDINWGEITSCYGDTEDFPRLLQALVSDIAAVRRCALGSIHSETLHQGTVYPITARVIPFLLRALEHPNSSKVGLLSFIENLASSAAPYRIQALEWDEDDDDRIAVLGTLEAVEAGYETIVKFADDEDTRELVVTLAEYCGDKGQALLRKTIETADGEVRAGAVRSFINLASTKVEDVEDLLIHEDPLVRCVASTTIALRFGAESPANTAQVLESCLQRVEDLAGPFSELSFVDGHLLAYLSLAAGALGTDKAGKLVAPLAPRLLDLSLFDIEAFCMGLFKLCFEADEPPFAADFLTFFEAIAKCERLDGFANFNNLARRWGLPADRKEYRALIEELRAAADPHVALQEKFWAPDEDE